MTTPTQGIDVSEKIESRIVYDLADEKTLKCMILTLQIDQENYYQRQPKKKQH